MSLLPADLTPETALHPDCAMYRRHVENGESIRALAREAGCHPSTMMRRIRRFESRRDDPLVDAALDRPASAADQRQLQRILRRLAEPGAVLAVAAGMDKAIVSRDEMRTAILDATLAEHLALQGWVELIGQGRIARYVLTASGRAALRAMLGGAGPVLRAADLRAAQAVDLGPEAAQAHRVWDRRIIKDPETGQRRRARARVNLAESPVQLLARRRGPDGKPFLSRDEIAAAERIREDFELAQLGPRVTQNWDRFMTSGVEAGRVNGAEGGSFAARDRVAAALRDLGPGMGDLVLRVCCFLEGIEATERRLGWSARSGKVVLRLALMRLARHYQVTYGSGTRLIG